jgi:hypothetical protein
MNAAIAWHVLVGICALAIWRGWRPTRRMAGLFLSAPLASVGIHAWAFDSPFNAIVFGVGAVALAILALCGPCEPVASGEPWAVRWGAGLVTFAWIYPHFLDGGSTMQYLYAAPIGTIPCPSLALVAGAALIGDGLIGGAWTRLLASMVTFYAVFGVLRLGVALDIVLLAGAVGLLRQHLDEGVRRRDGGGPRQEGRQARRVRRQPLPW